MIDDYIKKFEPIWGSWQIEALIGKGSYGRVYSIYKEEWGYRYESALKLISLPTKYQYDEIVYTFDGDMQAVERYFEDTIEDWINEIRLLYNLRGNSNIISYEDHLVKKKTNAIGWDILLRMEYADSLTQYTAYHKLTREAIIKLGMDICTALELCLKQGIIHRDIKEENIFVSKDGNFKLGDFGIAKKLTKNLMLSSIRGTPVYSAPEVFKGEKYDHRADQCSLGLVLYKLLNQGRLPFMPHYPEPIRYNDSETALNRRLSNECVPLPQMGQDVLGQIVLKACAYHAEERYQNPGELKEALREVLNQLEDKEKAEILIQARCKEAEPAPDLSTQTLDETILLENVTLKQSMKENPSGNNGNGGFAVYYNECIYLSDIHNSGGLYRVDTKSNEYYKLSQDCAWFLNISGDWLYYINESDGDCLYKIRIDGSSRTKLSDISGYNAVVSDDWVYFSSPSENNCIAKVNVNGRESVKLAQTIAHEFQIIDSYIYYINKRDKNKIYRMNQATGEEARLNDEASAYLNVNSSGIYFSSKDDQNRIYRMNPDGSGKAQINMEASCYLNVFEDWVYYCSKDDQSCLYKLNFHSGEKQKLCSDCIDSFCIAGGWIYYMKKNSFRNMFRIDLNGNNSQEVMLDLQKEEKENIWIWL